MYRAMRQCGEVTFEIILKQQVFQPTCAVAVLAWKMWGTVP